MGVKLYRGEAIPTLPGENFPHIRMGPPARASLPRGSVSAAGGKAAGGNGRDVNKAWEQGAGAWRKTAQQAIHAGPTCAGETERRGFRHARTSAPVSQFTPLFKPVVQAGLIPSKAEGNYKC